MRVYIAGPYTKGDIAVNVRNAIEAATKVADAGHYPFIPHLSHFWHLATPKPYAFWTEQDFAWLPACDAIVRLPGESSGADAEVAVAQERGMPVYNGVEEFLREEA